MGQQGVEEEESGHLGTVILQNLAHVRVSSKNFELGSAYNFQ